MHITNSSGVAGLYISHNQCKAQIHYNDFVQCTSYMGTISVYGNYGSFKSNCMVNNSASEMFSGGVYTCTNYNISMLSCTNCRAARAVFGFGGTYSYSNNVNNSFSYSYYWAGGYYDCPSVFASSSYVTLCKTDSPISGAGILYNDVGKRIYNNWNCIKNTYGTSYGFIYSNGPQEVSYIQSIFIGQLADPFNAYQGQSKNPCFSYCYFDIPASKIYSNCPLVGCLHNAISNNYFSMSLVTQNACYNAVLLTKANDNKKISFFDIFMMSFGFIEE